LKVGRITRFARKNAVGALVLIGLAALWQVLSMIFRLEAVPGEPMVPGWQIVVTKTFISLSDYWNGGLGVQSVADGGPRTYQGAVLAIISNSWDTGLRLYTGLAVGAVVGTLLGLAVSWSRWTRRLVELPAQFLRTFPLLAMIPLFELWFGTYFIGMATFVAYGSGVIFFAGVVNAVKNVPQVYIDYAHTLGATRFRLYRTVILPAIFPELRSSILLSLGISWSAVLGAEYLGAQTGLGSIIVFSEQFAYLDRMFLVALLFILYASVSYAIFDGLSRRLLRWMPRAARESVPAVAAQPAVRS
jgi:sulfonate transport system permease protein